MKNHIFIICLSILTSCSNSNNEVEASSKVSIQDTIVKYDTLMIGYGGHLLYESNINPTEMLSTESQKPIPLDQTTSKDFLGDIGRNDTLKIFAEFSQCGEFGGNREYINIYRGDSNLECRIIKDSVVCRYDENGQKFFRIEDETYVLTESSSKAVADYLELLLRYSLKDKEWYTNAAGYFSATIIRGIQYRKDFSVDLFDSERKWIYFDLLKNEIKTTANIAYTSAALVSRLSGEAGHISPKSYFWFTKIKRKKTFLA